MRVTQKKRKRIIEIVILSSYKNFSTFLLLSGIYYLLSCVFKRNIAEKSIIYKYNV